MNTWMEKIRNNKKVVIGIAAILIAIVAVVLFLLLSENEKKSKAGVSSNASGGEITTVVENDSEEDEKSETTSPVETDTKAETTASETTTAETVDKEKTDNQSTSDTTVGNETTAAVSMSETVTNSPSEEPVTQEQLTTQSQTEQNPNQPSSEETTKSPETETQTEKNTEPETTKPEPQPEYQYGIPVIHINTDNNVPVTSNTETVMATFSLDGRNTGYQDIKNAVIKIRGRGHSTWQWEKKPYQIKFEEKTSVMGMAEAKRYILLANYSDKTLMRNHIAYTMGDVLDNLIFVPHTEPVDVYLNGTYIGVYSIGEKVEVKKGRVEIEQGDETSANTGYLLEVGGYDDEDDGYGFNTDCLKDVVVKTPEYEVITKEQEHYIEDYVKKAEQAIKNLSDYKDYIDVDSFVDWFILHELTYNLDSCFKRSCYMVKEAGGKLQMGPPWDFDVAFGNYIYDNPNYDGWASVGSSEQSSYIKVTWMNYLLSDSKFNAKLKKRWEEKKDELVSVALAEIKATKNRIYKSQLDNFKVWDVWNVRAGYGSDAATALHTYDEQITYLENFIKNRKEWMDNAIRNLP